MFEERTSLKSVKMLDTGVIEVQVQAALFDGDKRVEKYEPSNERYTLEPGADLTGQPPEVTHIASLWTDEKIAERKAFLASAARANG